MSETVESPETAAPIDPNADRLSLCRALVADPRVAAIISNLPSVLPRPTPADAFVRAYDETLELLQFAGADGTLDILMTVGGTGQLLDRITAVRTQRAVMRNVTCEVAAPTNNPASNTTKKQRGPRKNINGRMAAALADDQTKLNWSARTWAEFLGCAESTVKGAKMWCTIQKMRAGERESLIG